ncbi:hypothetical protein E2C01_000727 [Portunus trituberculatus]|uniref:Uncharacterized protein n=1 Tax=Portunus trituberculatus TaxID=210409 RepID=A0A5B7CFV3_PORTR|nr:hypothetical protein [Portunus trituberculatus]
MTSSNPYFETNPMSSGLEAILSSPEHDDPPILGYGASQSRLLVLMPIPHDSLQLDHSPHSPHSPFTAVTNPINEYKILASVSASDPVQARPPWEGGGLSHVRNLRRWPPPQVAVQAPHGDHDDHPPNHALILVRLKEYSRIRTQ